MSEKVRNLSISQEKVKTNAESQDNFTKNDASQEFLFNCAFFLFSIITDTVAENAKQQFASLVSEAGEKYREKFLIFKDNNEKLILQSRD